MFEGVDTGRAILAQSSFCSTCHPRIGFDVVLPPALGPADGDVWDQLTMLVPARRNYLISFVGEVASVYSRNNKNYTAVDKWTTDGSKSNDTDGFLDVRLKNMKNIAFNQQESKNMDDLFIALLILAQTFSKSDLFYFQFACHMANQTHTNEPISVALGEWGLCANESVRAAILRKSTFCLILPPSRAYDDKYKTSTTLTQTRIYEALKAGTIPVVLGNIALPFEDLIDWRSAMLLLPEARVTELQFIIRSIADLDIIEMRRRGREIFVTYLGTTQKIVDSVIATVRRRIGIPAMPAREEPSPSVFDNVTFLPIFKPVVDTSVPTKNNIATVKFVEPSLNSVKFRRNITEGWVHPLQSSESDVFHLYPYTPFEPVMPADAHFDGKL